MKMKKRMVLFTSVLLLSMLLCHSFAFAASESEPNDSLSSANLINGTGDVVYNATLSRDDQADGYYGYDAVDYYRFELASAATVTLYVDLTFSSCVYNVIPYYVLNSSGGFIGSTNTDDWDGMTLNLQPGTYYIKVMNTTVKNVAYDLYLN